MTTKDIESWNELFPEVKMRETDLTHPTENFLTRTLIAYFRVFGYKVNLQNGININSPDYSKEKRLYLSKLTRLATRFLRITDSTYTFTYYDLIKPTPKKTTHMLDILLNYLYYFNMYKTEVLDIAYNRIKERVKIIQIIQGTRAENELCKAKAVEIKTKIAELSCVQIPTTRSELQKLNKKHQASYEQVQQLKFTLKELTSTISEMKAEERNMRKQIVPNNEAQELYLHVARLEEQVNERKQRIACIESSARERKESMRTIDELIEKINKITEALPIDFNFKAFKDNNKKLQETINARIEWENGKQNLLKNIKNNENSLKTLENKINHKRTLLEELIRQKSELIANKTKLYERNTLKLEELDKDRECLECELFQKIDVLSFLQESISVLFTRYKAK